MNNREIALGATALGAIGWYMYARNFTHFKYEEFRDRESGANKMQVSFIRKLDRARERAGVPFIINSGYRDKNHSESIKNPTSSHIKGVAVDIAVTEETRPIIEAELRREGLTRFGFGDNYIHVDDDKSKTQNVAWFYDDRPTLYNNTTGVYYV